MRTRPCLKFAGAADKRGSRNLGVFTTDPDTLIASADNESMYVRNQDVEFRLGWHVLKNMNSETGEWSLADRDVKEEEFFSQGTWTDIRRSLLGLDKLRNRSSKVLLRQIAAELPSLIDRIEIRIKSNACRPPSSRQAGRASSYLGQTAALSTLYQSIG
ncbi:hypothetical protein B7494_g6090 [Chlorociboria aeruginascens]|nr:hypothetical protein B7494_g6090 [Chlorociboria aeruginascens]